MSVKPPWYTYILNPDCVKKNPNANFVEWSTSVYIDSVGNILLILPGQMKNHIVCIFTVFLQNEFSNASLNCLNERGQSCIGFIYSIFHNVLVFNFSQCVSFLIVPQVAWSYRCKVTLLAFLRIFSRMSFQMRPQTACMNRCKVALARFMRFFNSVSFLMVPQVAWSYICKVTLFAFVRFFSKIIQMCPQTACMNRFKVALATFIRFFPRVSFLRVFQVACSYRCKVTMFAFIRFFSKMIFSNVS